VRQIVVTNTCNDDSQVLLSSNSNCVEETWIMKSELHDGVKTFTVPVSLVTKQAEDKIKLSVFACRFDGCVYEKELTIPYRTKITYADKVKVYDRYEWTYEWNDEIYHVQEVLLVLPAKETSKVKLKVRCDKRELHIPTTEDNRASCRESREFTNADYQYVETDELGNVYNMRIESVTNNISIEDSGSVELEFIFFDKQNNVAHTVLHRPVQKEEVSKNEEKSL